MTGELFDCEIQARFRDINLGGHVDNIEAMRIIDEARIQFFRFAPLPHQPVRTGLLCDMPSGVAELVGGQRVDYHAEMRFAPFQPFLVRLWVSGIGRTSFSVSTEMRVAPDHEPALIADTTLVFWDAEAQASWEISDQMRAALERYLGPRVALRG
ncbi:thioesterase family protein [Nocardioides sp. R-C-SC26]|uniref:acyl-CoA thioesterase n=1 Tax=Nocardioides sp. R-C-SC26 TaxID=2870414 RepID=UPI001E654F5B|nr:thioesterase family protein [Nocardioides sp. R-C-SC26]